MAIVHQRNKSGTVYVFESHSYRDKETGRPKSIRKCIGKLDPDTGEIIPTGNNKVGAKRKLRPKGDPAEAEVLRELYDEAQERISTLQAFIKKQKTVIEERDRKIAELMERDQKFMDTFKMLSSACETIQSVVTPVLIGASSEP